MNLLSCLWSHSQSLGFVENGVVFITCGLRGTQPPFKGNACWTKCLLFDRMISKILLCFLFPSECISALLKVQWHISPSLEMYFAKNFFFVSVAFLKLLNPFLVKLVTLRRQYVVFKCFKTDMAENYISCLMIMQPLISLTETTLAKTISFLTSYCQMSSLRILIFFGWFGFWDSIP